MRTKPILIIPLDVVVLGKSVFIARAVVASRALKRTGERLVLAWFING